MQKITRQQGNRPSIIFCFIVIGLFCSTKVQAHREFELNACKDLISPFKCIPDTVNKINALNDVKKARIAVGNKALNICKILDKQNENPETLNAFKLHMNEFNRLKKKEIQLHHTTVEAWNSCVMPIRSTRLIKEACEKEFVSIMIKQTENGRPLQQLELVDLRPCEKKYN
jgi:hypothetical protein